MQLEVLPLACAVVSGLVMSGLTRVQLLLGVSFDDQQEKI
jgi:hypothetical protein